MKAKKLTAAIGILTVFFLFTASAWADDRKGGDYRRSGDGDKQGYQQKYDGHRSSYRVQPKDPNRPDQDHHRGPDYGYNDGNRHPRRPDVPPPPAAVRPPHPAQVRPHPVEVPPHPIFWLFAFGHLAHHAGR